MLRDARRRREKQKNSTGNQWPLATAMSCYLRWTQRSREGVRTINVGMNVSVICILFYLFLLIFVAQWNGGGFEMYFDAVGIEKIQDGVLSWNNE